MMKHRQFSPTFASTKTARKIKQDKKIISLNQPDGWLRSYYETSASTTLTRWIVDQTDKDKDKDKDSHEDSDKNKDRQNINLMVG